MFPETARNLALDCIQKAILGLWDKDMATIADKLFEKVKGLLRVAFEEEEEKEKVERKRIQIEYEDGEVKKIMPPRKKGRT